MEKLSHILKPSTRATWKFDLPQKPERLTDPREAEGFNRNSLPVRLPAEVPQSVPENLEPMKGTKLNTVA